ncbi:MAG: ABC transporter substrate-binding protein [Acidaminococcales bacterium]|jgi:ABC-type proline/glycine betaine transport system substrate-binding protein|nr:ABC transporter substrate-binding protein [Acidaminococcales bacterium]
MKKFLWILTVAAAVFLGAACGGPGAEGDKKVALTDAGWDSIRIHNEIVKIIAEKAYNMKTEVITGSTPVTHTALLRGDIDVNLEMWTSNIATYKDDLKTGSIVELGINFDDNRQGIYVPRYVIEGDARRGIKAAAPDLSSVADLKRYPHVFRDEENPGKGRLYGAIPGWVVDNINFKKFNYYRLNENFIYFRPGSEATLYAAFVSAYEKGQPIAGYLWEPTWITGKYDFVLLKDAPYSTEDDFLAGRTAFPSVPVAVVANKKFVAREPEFADFLKKYRTSSAYTAEALAYMQNNKADYAGAAKYMLKKYPDMLDKWLPADKARTVREYVAK